VAALPEDDRRAGVLAAREHHPRADVGVLEELARDDKVRWGMLQLAYRLDKKKERKAADEARLATLVECAERHDPRLQKKFN
jgi:hypothetical protein